MTTSIPVGSLPADDVQVVTDRHGIVWSRVDQPEPGWTAAGTWCSGQFLTDQRGPLAAEMGEAL